MNLRKWIVIMKRILLCIKIKLYEKFLHKDAMLLRIKRYRMDGANIGTNVRAFSPISSGEPYLISIGNNVTISIGVSFCTHDNSAIKVFSEGTDFVGPINIGDNCFIGMNSILLGGISIASNCIVGAGSVVTKSFEQEGLVIAGNPARVIGSVEKIRNKENKVFDFRGMNSIQKCNLIMNNTEKWLKK